MKVDVSVYRNPATAVVARRRGNLDASEPAGKIAAGKDGRAGTLAARRLSFAGIPDVAGEIGADVARQADVMLGTGPARVYAEPAMIPKTPLEAQCAGALSVQVVVITTIPVPALVSGASVAVVVRVAVPLASELSAAGELSVTMRVGNAISGELAGALSATCVLQATASVAVAQGGELQMAASLGVSVQGIPTAVAGMLTVGVEIRAAGAGTAIFEGQLTLTAAMAAEVAVVAVTMSGATIEVTTRATVGVSATVVALPAITAEVRALVGVRADVATAASIVAATVAAVRVQQPEPLLSGDGQTLTIDDGTDIFTSIDGVVRWQGSTTLSPVVRAAVPLALNAGSGLSVTAATRAGVAVVAGQHGALGITANTAALCMVTGSYWLGVEIGGVLRASVAASAGYEGMLAVAVPSVRGAVPISATVASEGVIGAATWARVGIDVSLPANLALAPNVVAAVAINAACAGALEVGITVSVAAAVVATPSGALAIIPLVSISQELVTEGSDALLDSASNPLVTG